MNIKIVNNWVYKGWDNAKFLWWKSTNIFNQECLVCIIFGIAFVMNWERRATRGGEKLPY